MVFPNDSAKRNHRYQEIPSGRNRGREGSEEPEGEINLPEK